MATRYLLLPTVCIPVSSLLCDMIYDLRNHLQLFYFKQQKKKKSVTQHWRICKNFCHSEPRRLNLCQQVVVVRLSFVSYMLENFPSFPVIHLEVESNGKRLPGKQIVILYHHWCEEFWNGWELLHNSVKRRIWPWRGYSRDHGEVFGGKGYGKKEEAWVKMSSLWVIRRMVISSGCHLGCWGNTLHQQGGWRKREAQCIGGLEGLGSRSEVGRDLPALGKRLEVF